MVDTASRFRLRPWTSLPRPLLLAVAILLCASTTLYAALWIYDVRTGASKVELGFNKSHNEVYSQRTHSIFVGDVVPDSPAERAGLQAGDRIIGVNGQALDTSAPYDQAYGRGRPGDPVDFTIARPRQPDPITLHGTFRASTPDHRAEGLAQSSAQQILNSFPALFVLVGFAVLFLRLDDPNAWLLALMFSSFATLPSFPAALTLHPALHAFLFAYRAVFNGLFCSLFYFFLAVFPMPSPLERRFPWLKWVAIAVGVSMALPALATGEPALPLFVAQIFGATAWRVAFLVLRYALIALGLLSLAQNAFSAAIPPEARRKSRVLLWGTVAGVMPAVLERAAQDFAGYAPSYWINALIGIVLILYPLSFAYAIVKHRVLEIPVLLRRSVRYVLVQRGYFLLLFCAALLAIFLFTRFFARYFAENSQYGMALSAGFGVALVWFSGPVVRRGTDRIDRAFFRSSYDARMILQDLAQKTLTVTDRQELAGLLELHIEEALHPKSMACYLEAPDGNLTIRHGTIPRESARARPPLPPPKFPSRFGARFVLQDMDTIPPTLPLLVDLARGGKAWDVPPPVSADEADNSPLAPECLVPILGRNSGLIGLLVLGPRLSEEPYSSEAKQLLESVAGQAAVALENMRLAEQMARRLELDRRAEHEMQIARDVQSRLFPQMLPPLTSLDYSGSCIQARQVGGDYYDFLDLGSSQRLERGATRSLPAAAWHLAFVLADISGKGIAAALLMANLQANLRSRYALALDDLPRLLKSVNQLFYENTPDDRYATLFFGVYDDHSRELEYANCGHNFPLLFRANGSLERLESTSMVIGLFPDWDCVTSRVTLAPGDLLVIYTDGVTEAADASGNEFGEERLIETVCKNRELPPAHLVSAIQRAVQGFSDGEQFDDLTLVVARAR
jgi:phosphoserine phosphatase RsbU/P